jgi:hypothetical protein
VDLLTLYSAFAVCVVASLVIVAVLRDLNRLVLVLAGLFPIFALSIPAAVLWFSRGGRGARGEEREPPRWIRWIPRAGELLSEVSRAPRRLVRNRQVLLVDGGLQLLVFLLDAATLWAMLRAVGYDAHPAAVFASFVFAQVAATVLLVPGGLGTFEASSVAMLTLFRVPVEIGLTATLLLRGFTYWLPMAPGFWLSQREIKAGRIPRTAKAGADRGNVRADPVNVRAERGNVDAERGNVRAERVNAGADRVNVRAESVNVRADRVNAGAERGSVGAERVNVHAEPGNVHADCVNVAAERVNAGAERVNTGGTCASAPAPSPSDLAS